MKKLRVGRQNYYNIFSHFYDFFIKIHSRNYKNETRKFIVASAKLENQIRPKVLDICCGTGSVVLAFAERFDGIFAIGYDFSIGMLRKAKEKDFSDKVNFVEGDAGKLPFVDDYFDIVCCSHALYELKGQDRKNALLEMNRVVGPKGKVLIMEHEVPKKKLIKILFNIRMLMMGPTDARDFLKKGISTYKEIFPNVKLAHPKSGKSKLVICCK